MDDVVRKDILDVLDRTLNSVRRNDLNSLKSLSDMTVHNASIYQDQVSISVAVMIYSLAKMFERTRYEKFSGWAAFCKDSVSSIEKAHEELEHGEDEAFEETLKKHLELVDRLGHKLRQYINDVLLKARISKGSRLYEHGISLERTAYLLGVTQYELMDYIGKTHIADVKMKVLIHPRDRMAVARSLFK